VSLFVLTGLLVVAGIALVTEYTSAPAGHARLTERSVVDVTDYRRPGHESDTPAIKAAIAAADPGDTVVFPPGVYELDRPFQFRAGVNYEGTEATLRARDSGGLVLSHPPKADVHDVTIRGLTFDNVSVELNGTRQQRHADITFVDCRFRGGIESDEWSEPYLRLTYTTGVTVDSCEFLRGAGHGGRGIIARLTDLTVIKDSYFGTTADLEPGVPYGHFRTAINISGYDEQRSEGSRETVVDGNVWRRTPSAELSGECDGCQDHGLYSWGTDRMFVVGNRADGWDTSAAGGSIKLRNQQNTFVLDNTLSTSGILTYVYDSQGMPNHLKRLVIRGNTINLLDDAQCRGAYCGISFWRNFTGDGLYERGVYIAENTFTAGGTIRISQAHGPEFCVEDNPNAEVNDLSGGAGKGIRRLGCTVPREWARPLAGVHRGDFNGDGAEDFVHYVEPDGEPGYWRAHLSDGDGFVTEDWGSGVYTSTRTEEYGVLVGDFDGDGLDDLTYSGQCGDGRTCWRMHRSTGSSFADATDWGHGVYASHETTTFGFAVGDFDGDGLDDLVSRGYCGDRRACWRVHTSTGESFVPHDAGDDARWSDDVVMHELLVGDYDADGRDDVAYLGVCGSKATSCFRVHLSDGHEFEAHDWGGDTYFAGDLTSHFGLRVHDANADGRSDIAYVGRCGSDGPTQWRHHVSTGDGFRVRCAPSRSLTQP